MALLLVVATPIGNLQDLSPAMAAAFERADLIAAEDTRVTQKLLHHLGLRRPMLSMHRHNERERAPALARRMQEEDLTVALVTDAGTPGISDPGAVLVKEAARAGVPVDVVSGPSAVAAALSVCGFSSEGYAFHGFLPREEGPRRKALTRIAGESQRVAVVYEAPSRVEALCRSVQAALPEAELCLCGDLTKKFQKILRGSPQEVAQALAADPNAAKGEYVLVMDLSGCPMPDREATPSARGAVLDGLLSGLDEKQAVAAATKAGVPRNAAYQAMLEIRSLLRESM